MKEAIKEAEKSIKQGDYGIGSVIVFKNKIISRAGNSIFSKRDSLAHAEFLAIEKLRNKKIFSLKNRKNMAIYTTLEPCPMCYGAITVINIPLIVCGAQDKPSGFSKKNLPKIYKKVAPKIIYGVLSKDCYRTFSKNKKEVHDKYLKGLI